MFGHSLAGLVGTSDFLFSASNYSAARWVRLSSCSRYVSQEPP